MDAASISPQDLKEAAKEGTLLRKYYEEKAQENPEGHQMTAVDYSRLQMLRELNLLIKDRKLTVAEAKKLLAAHLAIEFTVVRDMKRQYGVE